MRPPNHEESVSITRGFRLKTGGDSFYNKRIQIQNQEESVSITDYSIQTQNQEDSCSRSAGRSFYNKKIQTQNQEDSINYRRIQSSQHKDSAHQQEAPFPQLKASDNTAG
jgi:hypothetical protein